MAMVLGNGVGSSRTCVQVQLRPIVPHMAARQSRIELNHAVGKESTASNFKHSQTTRLRKATTLGSKQHKNNHLLLMGSCLH